MEEITYQNQSFTYERALGNNSVNWFTGLVRHITRRYIYCAWIDEIIDRKYTMSPWPRRPQMWHVI